MDANSKPQMDDTTDIGVLMLTLSIVPFIDFMSIFSVVKQRNK